MRAPNLLLRPRLLLAVAAVAPLLLATRAAAEPAIFKAAGQTRVELSSGRQVQVALPDGAEISAAAEARGAFWAAGTKPAPGGSEIVLWAGEGERTVPLPAPPGRGESLRAEPTPLVADDRLAALVWLEGKDRRSLGVRVAAWNGTGWGRARVVAPPGPGSQLALAAAPLADGTWLLAWSAFDGEDDEIVWSRGRLDAPGSWSRPQPVTANHVPDITPALTALPGGGAALAWSTFDGTSYSTVVARFDPLKGGRFGRPQALGGTGSLYPTFAADGQEVDVVVRRALPRGWEVWRLDAAARPVEKATLAAESAEENARPVIRHEASGAVTLRWPGSDKLRQILWQRAAAGPGGEEAP